MRFSISCNFLDLVSPGATYSETLSGLAALWACDSASVLGVQLCAVYSLSLTSLCLSRFPEPYFGGAPSSAPS